MTVKKDIEDINFKYLRPGHVDLNRPCDAIVKYATELLPGTGVLPQRWKYTSKLFFDSMYGHLGPFVWAKTASYHMLMVRGEHAFRIWTDSANKILCDINHRIVPILRNSYEIIDIPASTWRKTKPFQKRIVLRSEEDVDILMLAAMKAFGMA